MFISASTPVLVLFIFLAMKALTAQKLENIKDQVREEVEDPFRKVGV